MISKSPRGWNSRSKGWPRTKFLVACELNMKTGDFTNKRYGAPNQKWLSVVVGLYQVVFHGDKEKIRYEKPGKQPVGLWQRVNWTLLCFLGPLTAPGQPHGVETPGKRASRQLKLGCRWLFLVFGFQYNSQFLGSNSIWVPFFVFWVKYVKCYVWLSCWLTMGKPQFFWGLQLIQQLAIQSDEALPMGFINFFKVGNSPKTHWEHGAALVSYHTSSIFIYHWIPLNPIESH